MTWKKQGLFFPTTDSKFRIAELGFGCSEVTRDSFLGETVQVLQPQNGYRAGIDSVLLAAAVPAKPGQSVLELGCGAGVVSICLARRVGGLTLAGLELQTNYAELAIKNSIINDFQFEVVEGDVADPPRGIRARQFDHVIANPPYLRRNAGGRSSDAGRDCSNRESTPLRAWINCAVKRLKPSGCFTMIHRAERLDELLVEFEGRSFRLKSNPFTRERTHRAFACCSGRGKIGTTISLSRHRFCFTRTIQNRTIRRPTELVLINCCVRRCRCNSELLLKFDDVFGSYSTKITFENFCHLR